MALTSLLGDQRRADDLDGIASAQQACRRHEHVYRATAPAAGAAGTETPRRPAAQLAGPCPTPGPERLATRRTTERARSQFLLDPDGVVPHRQHRGVAHLSFASSERRAASVQAGRVNSCCDHPERASNRQADATVGSSCSVTPEPAFVLIEHDAQHLDRTSADAESLHGRG